MILITGGAGYVGTHTLIELSNADYDYVVYDNLCNASYDALKRVEKVTGKSVVFVRGDIRDKEKLQEVFESYAIDAVIHFAGLKAVGESVEKPLEYYDNNVNGTLVLLDVMRKKGCKTLVFSSSATVYGEPKTMPIREDFPTGDVTNPYGRTKYFIEEILKDLYNSDNSWKIAILRYFNPVGAHESGLIGEDPKGIPNNLMPYIAQVASGKLEKLRVFGGDYPTKDGTGVRDYIHVVDLALGHLKAIEYLAQKNPQHNPLIVNLGTGQGYSVLEMLEAYEKATKKELAYEIVGRREGDIAECYADPSFAKKIIGWSATRGVEQMCESVAKWVSGK